MSSCRFSFYLSSVVYQNNDDCQHLDGREYNNSLKAELNSVMENFLTSTTSCINISNCVFRDIASDGYPLNNEMYGAALRLMTSNNGGIINISNSQFHSCTCSLLASHNCFGGALYIYTRGDKRCSITLNNLVFSECNAYDGAAFAIQSECPINFTEIYCRNINITNCINLPMDKYFQEPNYIINIQNCFISQFANVLFESINVPVLQGIICFSNCDGVVSSLQFTNISYSKVNPIIKVAKDDGKSHTLIFDGLGFQNIQTALPIHVSNPNDNTNLNVVVDNAYFNGTDFMLTSGSVSVSASITREETSGMNEITPSPSATASATPSISITPAPTVTETPTESPSETPDETPAETPTETAPASSPLPTHGSSFFSPTELFSLSFLFSPSQNYTEDNNTDDFNPPVNDRSVSGKADVGLIVGCTIAGIVVLVAIVLIILFFCIRKAPCCGCCEKTAFEPSAEESKTELCFFDETLNQAQ